MNLVWRMVSRDITMTLDAIIIIKGRYFEI